MFLRRSAMKWYYIYFLNSIINKHIFYIFLEQDLKNTLSEIKIYDPCVTLKYNSGTKYIIMTFLISIKYLI